MGISRAGTIAILLAQRNT